MLGRRVVLGLSGVSCTGKTTVSKLLRETFPWATVVHQDAYFHPNDPKYHVIVPELNHFNWDLKSAIDIKKMERDLKTITTSVSSKNQKDSHTVAEQAARFFPNDHFVSENRPTENTIRQLTERFSSIPLTFIEGHVIFNHKPFYDLCNFRYFLTLDKEECLRRRQLRVYDPPNPPGYFEKCGWPLHIERLEEVKKLSGIRYFDAKNVPLKQIYKQICSELSSTLENIVNNDQDAKSDSINKEIKNVMHKKSVISPEIRAMQLVDSF